MHARGDNCKEADGGAQAAGAARPAQLPAWQVGQTQLAQKVLAALDAAVTADARGAAGVGAAWSGAGAGAGGKRALLSEL